MLFGPKSDMTSRVEGPCWALWAAPEGPIQGTYVIRRIGLAWGLKL